jgi:hypothetical protein
LAGHVDRVTSHPEFNERTRSSSRAATNGAEMTRDSTKHGPKLDDALKGETRSLEQGAPAESRVQENREAEGPGEFDRDVDARTAPPGALGSDAVEARREISRHLRLSAFPAGRAALVAEAEEQNAPEPVLAILRTLPEDATFETVHEVWAALEGYDDPREAAAHDPVTDADS